MQLRRDRTSHLMDRLLVLATTIYYLLIDGISIIVGREGNRLGGAILFGQLVIVVMIYIIGNNCQISCKLSKFHLYFLLFIGYCFINCFWATYGNQALARTEQLAKIGLLMIILYTVFEGRKNAVDELLTVIMLGGFFLVAAYIVIYGWSYIVLSLRNADRVTSDIINTNTLGMAAAYSCVIFFHRLLLKKIRIWWLPFVFLSFVTLFASQSRKALLIIFIGVIGVFLLNNHHDRNKIRVITRTLAAIIVVIVLLVILVRFGVLAGAFERVEGLLNSFSGKGSIEKSTLQRTTLISLGEDLFKQHPIGGIGIDCARFFSPYGTDYHLHNNYWELLADAGILGLIIYYWLYLYIFIEMMRRRDFDNPEFNICMVILVIRLITDYGFFSYKEQGTYFFLLLLYLFYKKNRNKSKSPNMVFLC